MTNIDSRYIITTQELAMMMRECNIDIDTLKSSEFDHLLSKGSKSGIMFGRSGGVMESSLNALYYFVNKRSAKEGKFHHEFNDGITISSHKINGKLIRVAVVSGLKNLEQILPHKQDFDFIEVMNCPGGCIGGGGEPLTEIKDLNLARTKRYSSLNEIPSKVNFCFENQDVKDLYSSYLKAPLSEKSVMLLHTKHSDLSSILRK